MSKLIKSNKEITFKQTVFGKLLFDFHQKKINIILFELIHSLVGIFFVYPTMLQLLNISVKLSSYKVITKDNFITFISNPITIVFLIIILLIWSIYACIGISGLCLIFDEKYHQEENSLGVLINTSIHYAKRIIHPKNIPLLFTLMFILPLFSLALSAVGFNLTSFPTFIINSLNKNITTQIILYFGLFVILSISLFGIFVFNFFNIEKKSFIASIKASFKLAKKHFKKLIFYLSILNAIIILFCLLLYIIFSLIIAIGIKLIGSEETQLTIFLSIMYIFSTVLRFIFKIIFLVGNYSMITNLFNLYYKSKNEITYKSFRFKITNKVIISKRLWLIFITIFLLYGSIGFFLGVSKGSLNVLGLNVATEVSAHRGNSMKTPENTISSITSAIEIMADYVEIDLQQTKDGRIVVFHDPTLKRICGVNKRIADLTYEELLQYDVGKHFSNDFIGETIPLFEEVLAITKNKIKLNIEIKNCPHNSQFFDDIYNMIIKYNFKYNCYITSTNYNYLKKIKSIDEDIKTGYILFFALGNYTNLKYADFVSMLYANVNLETVKKVHQAGLEIHVWTVNNSSDIVSMISIGVDNIITDDPSLAKKVIYTKRTDYILQKVMNIFFKQEQNIFKLLF